MSGKDTLHDPEATLANPAAATSEEETVTVAAPASAPVVRHKCSTVVKLYRSLESPGSASWHQAYRQHFCGRELEICLSRASLMVQVMADEQLYVSVWPTPMEHYPIRTPHISICKMRLACSLDVLLSELEPMRAFPSLFATLYAYGLHHYGLDEDCELAAYCRLCQKKIKRLSTMYTQRDPLHMTWTSATHFWYW